MHFSHGPFLAAFASPQHFQTHISHLVTHLQLLLPWCILPHNRCLPELSLFLSEVLNHGPILLDLVIMLGTCFCHFLVSLYIHFVPAQCSTSAALFIRNLIIIAFFLSICSFCSSWVILTHVIGIKTREKKGGNPVDPENRIRKQEWCRYADARSIDLAQMCWCTSYAPCTVSCACIS